ncbi:helix-turn-helix transcriptional regulator [Legionella lytica]|uniref:Helix-turn-helix transcriptional regulator n=1 Tax=Legionella lytica TaxID=96232 RepID=A0ABY4Y906_9GAMM|nr:helix-turn-helix transcriptional regulator [Legionella lytica]USQ13984.1 helix-turn-helix transcriptional regulator [Legionella lytica]
MTSSIIKHPALTYSQDIQDICSPLQHLDITYFGHAQLTENNQFSAASTNPTFFEHYLKNEYYNADLHTIDLGQQHNFIAWDTIQLDGMCKMMEEESLAFGVFHTFTIIENVANIRNYYHFATRFPKPEINQSYFSNLDLLQKFITHYKEQISHSKTLSSIYQVQYELDCPIYETTHAVHHEEQRKTFLKAIVSTPQKSFQQTFSLIEEKKLATHFLKTHNITLTNRECDCLLLTLTGKSAKQVAYQLNISSRTVEEHLNNIKMKFGVFSKTQLIETVIAYLSKIST